MSYSYIKYIKIEIFRQCLFSIKRQNMIFMIYCNHM